MKTIHSNNSQYNHMAEYVRIDAILNKAKKGLFIFSPAAIDLAAKMPLDEKQNIIENIIGNYPFKGLICKEDKYGLCTTDNPNILIVQQFMKGKFEVYGKKWSEFTPLIQGCIEDYSFTKITIKPQDTMAIVENYYKF